MPLPQPILDWLMPLSRFEHLFNRMQHELRDDLNARANETSRSVQNQLGNINRKLEHLMSAISDFAAAMTAFNDRQDKAVAALQDDVKALNDKIAALQNSPGVVSPEDQALLDGIQAHAGVIADKLDALDAITPPAAPPAP